MKKLILTVMFLTFIPACAIAQEIIPDFKERSVPVLNEELRKIRRDLRNAQGNTECATEPCDLHENTTLNETEICLEDGTNCGTGIPGGPNTSVQFNDGGAFNGDPGFLYDKASDSVEINGGLMVDQDTFNVDEVGNVVGAGTKFPQERLHVIGNIKVPYSTYSSNFSTGNILFGDGNRMYFDSDNNLYIGDPVNSTTLTGGGNIAIGSGSAQALTSGTLNVIIGHNAGQGLTSADNTIIIGANSGISLVDTDDNIIIGTNAGQNLSTFANDNICIGATSCNSLTFSDDNIVIGTGAMGNGSGDASQNVAIGDRAMEDITTGDDNTCVGHVCQNNLTEGIENVCMGFGCNSQITTGNHNVCVGNGCNDATTVNDSNVCVGDNCLTVTTGTFNTAIGQSSGQNITTGDYNTALGPWAMFDNDTSTQMTGNYNIGVGYISGAGVSSGNENIYIGREAGFNDTTNMTGDGNIGIGTSVLNSLSTGTQNIVLGALSGQTLTTGDNNVILGDNSDVGSGSVSNSVVIGSATTVSDSNVAVFNESLRVGIGTTSVDSSAVLELAGTDKAILLTRVSDPGSDIITPVNGMVAYDNTDDELQAYVAGSWQRTAFMITGTANIDFDSTPAHSSTEDTVTLTGAATIDTVSIGFAPDVITSGSNMSNAFFSAWVSATDTVTIRFSNNDSSLTADPAAGVFKATIIK